MYGDLGYECAEWSDWMGRTRWTCEDCNEDAQKTMVDSWGDEQSYECVGPLMGEPEAAMTKYMISIAISILSLIVAIN